MGRIYTPKVGSRRYQRSDSSEIEAALKAIIDGGMSIRKAAKLFKVPYGTLNNRYHGRHVKQAGGQTVLTQKEEEAITENLLLCSDWGYPISKSDLPYFVKSLLDSTGIKVKKFNNNMPGEDWVNGFLKRNKRLSMRWASNISRARAKVSAEVMQEYFDNLEENVKDVPPSNVFNYDETNVTDDPGKKQSIYRRGVKYPEKVCNHSKSAISIMMCGAADGTLLPPYVIYKAENMWDSWTRGGPKGSPCCSCSGCSRGSRYNRSSHGWMDMSVFDEWFHSSFVPHARKLPGRKVLIGDNLASHFSPSVLKTCKEENISFTCLPPNSTNLCQPLDVSFFRPFKLAWRQVLTMAKKRTPTTSLQKDRFPPLLKETLEKMDAKKEEGAIKLDLIAGFRACGIVPFDPTCVLTRLPDNETKVIEAANVSDSLLEFLRKERHGQPSSKRVSKKKKLNVEPGKSVTYESSTEEELPDLSQNEDSSDSSASDSDLEDPDVDNAPLDFDVGDYVLCNYNGKQWPGKILSIVDSDVKVKFFEKGNKFWKWPIKEDILEFEKNDILTKISTPKNLKRGWFSVPETSE